MDKKLQDQIQALGLSLPTGATMCLHDVAIGPLPGQRATVVILAEKGAVPDDVDLSFAATYKLLESIQRPTIDGPPEFMIQPTEVKPYDLSQFKPFETIMFGQPPGVRVPPESLARFRVMEKVEPVDPERVSEFLASVEAQTNKPE